MYDKAVIDLDLLPSNMNHMHKNIVFKPPPDNNEDELP
jgi:hypothetical protein